MSEKEEMNTEELDNIIVLTDEDGKDVEFEWLDTIEMKDNTYVVVVPTEEETDEVVILKMEKEDEEETFVGLEDETEINEVFEEFKERNKEIAKKIKEFLESNDLELGKDINPAVVDYEEVQQGTATQTVEKEEKNIKNIMTIIGEDKENKVYIDDYNSNHAEDSFYAYEDKYSIELELIDLPEEETPTEIIEDDVPDVPEEPKSKYGQVYQLGNHRLMCGDSTKNEDVEKLLNGVKADLLITDPPYNVSMERKSKDVLKSDNYSHIENDELSEDEFKIFLKSVFTNANDSLKDDASYYVFSCQGGDSELMMMMRECGIRCRHQIIWVKDAPVFSMGRLDYDYKHEPILYGWKKKHNFYRKGQQDKSVWEFKRTANKLHPTMKPVDRIDQNKLPKNVIIKPYIQKMAI